MIMILSVAVLAQDSIPTILKRVVTAMAPKRKRVLETTSAAPGPSLASRRRVLAPPDSGGPGRAADRSVTPAGGHARERTLARAHSGLSGLRAVKRALRPTPDESLDTLATRLERDDHRSAFPPWPASLGSRPKAGSTSSSGSTCSGPKDEEAKRERTLEQRKRRRERHYTQARQDAEGAGTSFLQSQAVSGTVGREYYRYFMLFLTWAGLSVAASLRTADLDDTLSRYFENLFFLGHQPAVGEKTFASVLHHWPQFSKVGSKSLAGSWRAIKGWRRLCPGRSRYPMPRSFWMGMAVTLCHLGQVQMAVFVLIAVSSYLRPSSMFSLSRGSLVPPVVGVTKWWTLLAHPHEEVSTSKTHEKDVSILMDSAWLAWMGPVYEKLRAGNPSSRMWDFGYLDLVANFRKASLLLGVKVTPYQMRHSGASADRADHSRPAAEVQGRGGWKSLSSVARYEKVARLAQSATRLRPEVSAFCDRSAAVIQSIVLRGDTAPAPPILCGAGAGSRPASKAGI